MAEETEDDASKTEEPSQKKLEDARKKGQIAQSREVNHFFMMLALTFIIMVLFQPMGNETLRMFAPYIQRVDSLNISGTELRGVMLEVALNLILLLALPLLIAVIAAFAPAIIQNKFVFSTEHIKPKFSKISPLAGFNRLFGGKAWIEFGKNLLKIGIVGCIGWYMLKPHQDEFKATIDMGLIAGMETGIHMGAKVMIAVCAFLFLLAAGDYVLQRFIMMKQLRMTKKELKDEYKQQEGDPHIKSKQKQIRRERARQRMIQNVPDADVVVTNPTHYAVALKYDQGNMQAPKLVAKGADKVAAKIREIAEKNKVPIIRNPPLARVLYDTLDIDDEVPQEHYAAVAKIIGYVYRMKGKLAGAKTASNTDKGKMKGLSQKNTPPKPPR
jgi:flagellar biosynthetic protein FlhB